jgi:rare lipoprotein A
VRHAVEHNPRRLGKTPVSWLGVFALVAFAVFLSAYPGRRLWRSYIGLPDIANSITDVQSRLSALSLSVARLNSCLDALVSALTGTQETLLASWYGPGFHGRLTASGTPFDRHGYTAAHRTLPLGSLILVHNPATGAALVLPITDRGPYVGTRALDVSEAVALYLGFHKQGLANLSVTRLDFRQHVDGPSRPPKIKKDKPRLSKGEVR